MRLHCFQQDLAPILRSLGSLLRKETLPDSWSVLLYATAAQENKRGTVTVVAVGLFGSVGLLKHLPATVEEEGQVLIPIQPFADYIDTVRPGLLTLSHPSMETDESSLAPPIEGEMPALQLQKATHPLRIESCFTSATGATSRNRASLTIWKSDGYPVPPFADWLQERSERYTLLASRLLVALNLSVPSAREKNKGRKEDRPEAYGVMVYRDADALVFSATTMTMLIAHRIPVTCSATSLCAGLFAGQGLAWIQKALPKQGMVTLTLKGTGAHAVVLVETPHLTLFCRAMEIVPSSFWTRLLHLPHQHEVLMERRDLESALLFLTKSLSEEPASLVFSTAGKHLELTHRSTSDKKLLYAQQTIRLAQDAPTLSLLVNPKDLAKIVKATTGRLLSMQVGHYQRKQEDSPQTVGFLRISDGATTAMMGLSRRVEQEPVMPPPSAEPALAFHE